MTRLAGGILALWLLAAPARGQLLSRQLTNPVLPSPRALERLNLKLAWRAYLPVGGTRDGLFTVQLLGNQILVQTVAGTIVALDPERGTLLWKALVGVPYRVSLPLGYNQEFIFALRGDRLFALERSTGRKVWEYILPDGPTAAPVADAFGVYVAVGTGRVYAYILPDLKAFRRYKEMLASRREEGNKGEALVEQYGGASGIPPEQLAAQRKEIVPEPEAAWDYLFEEGQLYLPPLQTPNYLLFASGKGTLFSLFKFEREERYRFRSDAPVSAPLGQYGHLAYIGSEDNNLYALDIKRGIFEWRFVAGGSILQQPAVTDQDVYVAATRRGLYCVDREKGQSRWLNRTADHFLAVNRRFVYAADRNNRLLVLDRFRGLELGRLDTRDFVIPVSNDQTDRVYLASHNGLFVCLRDLDQKAPLRSKNVTELKAKGFKPKEEKPVEKKPPKEGGEKLGEKKKPAEEKKKEE